MRDWLTKALSIDGWMEQAELEWLHEAASKMGSVAEVGCWKGRSSIALLSGCKGDVYCIDHFFGSEGEEYHGQPTRTATEAKEHDIYSQFTQNTGEFDNRHIVGLDSLTAASVYADLVVDMVFIDGSHKYEDVLADIRAWRSKAKKLICGHDINWDGVERAVKEELGEVKHGPGAIWYLPLVKEEKPRLCVCLPGGGAGGQWLEGWNDLYGRLVLDYRVTVVSASGNNIYEVRNECVRKLAEIAKGDPPEHVLWIDSDNLVSYEGFEMLRHALGFFMLEASAVGAWYVMQPLNGSGIMIAAGKGDTRPSIRHIQEAAEAGCQLLEVEYMGLGFVLMKYSLLDELGLNAFNPILRDDGDFEMDDVSFFLRAGAKGHKFWMHSGVYSPHLKLQPIPVPIQKVLKPREKTVSIS